MAEACRAEVTSESTGDGQLAFDRERHVTSNAPASLPGVAVGQLSTPTIVQTGLSHKLALDRTTARTEWTRQVPTT